MKLKRRHFVCHCEAEGRGNLDRLDCFTSLAMTRRPGLTLPEMTVVITIAALIIALTIPAINMLLNSYESDSGAKTIINAALASARSIAIKNQQYAGIRFQKRYNPDNPDPIKESQYMIFIIKEGKQSNSLDYGFHAVDGIQPIKIPDSIGVMDLTYANRWRRLNDILFQEFAINSDAVINSDRYLLDTTTFSIIFSPSGKLIILEVRTRNRNEIPDTTANIDISYDIINKIKQIEQGIGMFPQDDYCGTTLNTYPDMGLGPEKSRNCFYIVDSKIFKQEYNKGTAWTGYLQRIAQNPVFINPYTGTIIDAK